MRSLGQWLLSFHCCAGEKQLLTGSSEVAVDEWFCNWLECQGGCQAVSESPYVITDKCMR